MHFPPLIQDLAIILGVAAIVTFLFRRIRQPVVLGYIVAGIIVGPHTPAIVSVTDTESIKVWAELGVIFLMFSLGLEFSFRRLAKVGLSAAGTAVLQILVMLACGVFTAKILGWQSMDAIFLGCMIAISSTTIIIKALEELGLKKKKFAELVFGILIVEDLAAILMLVALTNIATTSEFGGIKLLLAGGKLALVVGAWFLAGMFLVPRFVKSVSKHGNDEMLTVVATGLCLALVALAAYFHYSVALGAFIMGSIIAESSAAKRIEHLVQPLKDTFGAIFFVSVGMMLAPRTIIDNWGAIAILSCVIVLGKLISVTVGAILTGQTIRNSVQAGFSMAQIGEFSFIIATLGLSYGAISESLYPIIVASSLVTTFTTPYLVRSAPRVAAMIEGRMPERIRTLCENYIVWLQRRTATTDSQSTLVAGVTKWALNAIVVVTVFTVASEKLVPTVSPHFQSDGLTKGVAWLISLLLCSPSIWAMFSAFKKVSSVSEPKRGLPDGGALVLSRIVSTAVVGILSIEFFPAPVALGSTLFACVVVSIVLRKQVSGYYKWIERQFQSGFQADLDPTSHAQTHQRLVPWDAHLVEVEVPPRSFVVGKSLFEVQLREKYGLNVVVIVRAGESIVAPKATEIIYPSDSLLCFATDAEVERFRDDVLATTSEASDAAGSGAYRIQRYKIHEQSQIKGSTIRKCGIREKYDCIVVGLERLGQRIRSPHSETPLLADDILWIVGDGRNLQSLAGEFD